MYLALDGHNLGCRVLPDIATGIIVDELVKKDTLYKVQFEEFSGESLDCPKLWHYNEWQTSRTNFLRQKDRSEKERVARRIMEVNIKIVSKKLVDEFYFPEDRAAASAYNLLSAKKWGNIRALGVKNLITKEEELK